MIRQASLVASVSLVALAVSGCVKSGSPASASKSVDETKATAPATKKKALVIISSARSIELSSPKGTPSVAVGFFLVELAEVLERFGDAYEFTFATPDGKAPLLDLNGLDLNFHVQGPAAPYVNAFTNARNTDLGFPTRVREILGLTETPEQSRSKRKVEFARRQAELALAARHLGRLEVSEPLANTSKEAIAFRPEALETLSKAPTVRYLSLREVITADRDARKGSGGRALGDYDFVYIPGGHAPMVDMRDNAELGEVLNGFHEAGKPIMAICHGPIAMTSADLRVDEAFAPIPAKASPLLGAKVTTVSRFEETLMLEIGYVKQPTLEGPTRLTYFVDEGLKGDGFEVSYGSPMVAGLQLKPGYPNVVWDASRKVLTGNGPQAMDMMADRMEEILGTGKAPVKSAAKSAAK